MLTYLVKWRDFLITLFDRLLIPLMASIFFLLFIQVVLRYLFGISLFWVGELVMFMMAFICFIGSAGCIHDDIHPRVTLVFSLLPKRGQFLLNIIINLAILWFVGMFALEGYRNAIQSINRLTPALRISFFYPYLAMPIGGGLMFIITLLNTIIMLFTGEMTLKEKGLIAENTPLSQDNL